MNRSDQLEEIFLEKIVDESIQILKWEGWKSWCLALFMSASGLCSLGFKALIINFVTRFAPKDRPLNTLILFQQVLLGVSATLCGK